MNWYKKAQLISKNLLKNIDNKKQMSLQNGWTPDEVEWAGIIATKLTDPSFFPWLLNQTRAEGFKMDQFREKRETEDDKNNA